MFYKDVKLRDTCSICNKKPVCKYEDKFQKYVDEVEKVDKGAAPFTPVVKCTEFILNQNARIFDLDCDSYIK